MPSILVVDDDDAIRKLVALVARRQGFEVDLATDGLEALDLITQRSYDVAIVDLMMPRLNGYELVTHMKRLPERPFVVIVTAMTDSLVAQLDASIVQSVIRKPFDINLLGSLMTQLSAAMRERRGATRDETGPAIDDLARNNVVPFRDRNVC
jgi:DNA-binding response OmpR family regulator